MTLVRMIAPQWLLEQDSTKRRVIEGEFTDEEISEFNTVGYNIYFLPNHPKEYDPSCTVDGTHIDVFNYVFVDFDLKSGAYESKDAFIKAVGAARITPSLVVDSGNGIHVYWRIPDLDAKSYLKLSRRLMRLFNTDDAVQKIFQLMRLPETYNTKVKGSIKLCHEIFQSNEIYTCEELDKLLPPLAKEDELYCEQHYNKTYNVNRDIVVDDTLPPKFGKLLRDNKEAKDIWAGETDDRSKDDFRLGHLMFANGFTKEEATSVLVNSAKAITRAPVHRVSYASNIVDKIWTYEEQGTQQLTLSRTVLDVLQASGDNLQGTRLHCWKYIDDTECGFRLGHVMGLVAGAGVGKTAMALNIFLGFVKFNPEYDHFFVPLEQTDREIASRWKAMCGNNTNLHSKVHIISNYDENGVFRDLSLVEIKDYINKFKKETGKKVGCVVIDHIGILCNNNKLGQDEGVKDISKAMKGFAQETETFLIMQSQTSRSKSGIGDIELDKDSAFGTSVFENFCDYLVTLWQPLKRVYGAGAPTIMSYKFCKIRHKKQGVDKIMEDNPYSVYFEPETQLIRPLTQDETDSLSFWVGNATAKRKLDKKADIVQYTSIRWDNNEK